MSDAINLNDILQFSEGEVASGKIKVRFSKKHGVEDPIEIYQLDPELVNTNWLLWRGDKRLMFNVGDIAISLVQVSGDLWLLTTIKEITKELGVRNGINYEAKIIPRLMKYSSGRIFVDFHKDFQVSCRVFSKIKDKLIVNRIGSSPYEGDEFPGYDHVRLSYTKLAAILKTKKSDWINALTSQKAVYLITDLYSGKLYVGSATSERGMLLDRWSSYVKTFHGGDVDLMTVCEQNDYDYVRKYFQYSIIENYNSNVDDHIVLDRESYWKTVLDSRRPHGYNGN